MKDQERSKDYWIERAIRAEQKVAELEALLKDIHHEVNTRRRPKPKTITGQIKNELRELDPFGFWDE